MLRNNTEKMLKNRCSKVYMANYITLFVLRARSCEATPKGLSTQNVVSTIITVPFTLLRQSISFADDVYLVI